MKLIQIKETRYHGKVKTKATGGRYKIMSRNMVMKALSIDTDLEFESVSNLKKRKCLYKIKDINIVKNIPETPKEIHPQPMLFETKFDKDPAHFIEKTDLNAPSSDQTTRKGVNGVIRYRLSDPSFIDKGWTKLPIEKVVRKMNVYRMHPAHPEFDWFAYNKAKGTMTYDNGEKLATFDDNGRGRWFYKNGRLALDYYDSEETNCQRRFVVYSSGDPDEKGHSRPVTLVTIKNLFLVYCPQICSIQHNKQYKKS